VIGRDKTEKYIMKTGWWYPGSDVQMNTV